MILAELVSDRRLGRSSYTRRLKCDRCGAESRRVSVDGTAPDDAWRDAPVREAAVGWVSYLDGWMKRDACAGCASVNAHGVGR